VGQPHTQLRCLAIVLSCLAVAVAVAAAAISAQAAQESLRAMRLPGRSIETGPTPDLDIEAPPSAYPLAPVEQMIFRGARHGLVNTTTGTLAFRMTDLKLPGRMPIDFGRVYDTAMSASLPPPPPSQPWEPRWTTDLGPNWILGYAAYLVPETGGV
jgi:hypothetical protein